MYISSGLLPLLYIHMYIHIVYRQKFIYYYLRLLHVYTFILYRAYCALSFTKAIIASRMLLHRSATALPRSHCQAPGVRMYTMTHGFSHSLSARTRLNSMLPFRSIRTASSIQFQNERRSFELCAHKFSTNQ